MPRTLNRWLAHAWTAGNRYQPAAPARVGWPPFRNRLSAVPKGALAPPFGAFGTDSRRRSYFRPEIEFLEKGKVVEIIGDFWFD